MEENTNIEVKSERRRVEEPKETTNLINRKVDERVNIRTSETITNILPALVKFHKSLDSIEKSNANPFFKSKYSSLDNILEHIKPILAEQGLFIYQSIIDGGNDCLSVKTILFHESGEFIESDSTPFPIDKKNIQSTMSSISYIRRYAVNSVCNLAFKDEDNDANGVTGTKPYETQNTSAPTTPVRRGRR